MSVFQNLYLGPYAAFAAPPGTARLPEDEGGDRLGWQSFYSHLSDGWAYYMPRGAAGEAPKPAPRKMYFGGQPGWPWEPDLVGVVPADEMAWFAREYAAELAEVGAALGASPAFGWGLLSWYS
jgi:hypothetical protein